MNIVWRPISLWKKSIGTVLRNPKNPDHLKAKKMCKYAGKKLPFLIRFVPDL